MRLIPVLCTLLLLTSLPRPGVAQTLTREQAWERAIQANMTVLVARMERQAQARAPEIARRPFLPRVRLSADYQDAPNLQVMGTRNQRFGYSGALIWNTELGTSINLSAGSTEFFSGASFVPLPSTSVQLAVSQALLRDGWSTSNLLGQRDLDDDIQRALFLDTLNDFVLQVDQAYWNLAIAEADVAIKVRSLARARDQFETTQENIKRGILATSEIHLVEENTVFFEQQLLRSQESLGLARARLARLMRADARTPWSTGGAIDAYAPKPLSITKISQRALKTHPDVQTQELLWRQTRVQVAFEHNQARPRLDVSGSVGFNGLAQNRGAAWAEAVTGQNPDVRVGLNFEVRLDRGPLEARLEQANLRAKRAKLAMTRAQDNVRYDLESLRVQLATRQRLLDLAAQRVTLSERKLDTEREKYKRGLSTLPNVVLFQRDLDAARIGERQARVDLILLHSRVWAASGALPAQGGVEVD